MRICSTEINRARKNAVLTSVECLQFAFRVISLKQSSEEKGQNAQTHLVSPIRFRYAHTHIVKDS